jgi:hypothetical protein
MQHGFHRGKFIQTLFNIGEKGAHGFVKGQGAPENSQGIMQDIRGSEGSEDQGDREALDHQDGQLQELEEPHGQHAQEAAGGYCKAGCLN